MFFFKKKPSPRLLRFCLPGTCRSDTLCCGNGKTAFFVSGGVREERLIIHTCGVLACHGRKNNFVNALDSKSIFAEIKKNLSRSNIGYAERLLTNKLNSSGFEKNYSVHIPLCEFVFKFNVFSPPFDYERFVNFNEGSVNISFADKEGCHLRKGFVSDDGVICFRIVRDGGLLDVDFGIVDGEYVLPSGFDNFSSSSTMTSDKNYISYIVKAGENYHGIVALLLHNGGSLTCGEKFARIKDATSLYVFAKPFVNSAKPDIDVERIKSELESNNTSFEKMLELKENAFSTKMNVDTFELSKEKTSFVEQELIKLKTQELSLSLLEDLYYYGKYLFYSLGEIALESDCLFMDKRQTYVDCTPFDFEKCEPLLIQSENYLKPSRLMSFSLESGNCSFVKEYLLSMASLLPDFKANAINLFGCNGAFVPSVFSSTLGQVGSSGHDVLFNKCASAQLFALIYDYYSFSNDKEFMINSGYQLAKQIAQLYLSSLKKNKTSQMYEVPFGISPFSKPLGKKHMLASNVVCDFESAKYVFYYMSVLAKEFDEDDFACSMWQAEYDKVPDVEVDKDGIIKEYASNLFETDNSSPNIAHVFPYNIGFRAVNAKRDYDFLVLSTIKSRFVKSVGALSSRDLSDMALALATCLDGIGSFELLQLLIRAFSQKNLLFTSNDQSNLGLGLIRRNNFINIDVNTSITRCLQNMFVVYSLNKVYLFKNLPKRFKKITFRNLTLCHGLSISMQINNARHVVKLKLMSNRARTIDLFLPTTYRKHKGVRDSVDRQEMVLKDLLLAKDKTLRLKIYY